METITFYSYKGGSGRSLLLANAAHYLALLGKRVVAIDFDFEAPGLHYKLGAMSSPGRAGETPPERGVVDYLLAAADPTKRPLKITPYIVPVPVPRGAMGKLFLMPAGAAPTGAYWQTLTTLLRGNFLADPDGMGVAACLELKARIEIELKADFILIDSRTGITELGGLVTSLLSDKVISLVLDNRESLAGSRAVMRSFGMATRLPDQAPIAQYAVLSRVPDAKTGTVNRVMRYLNEPGPSRKESLGIDQLFVLRVDPQLAAGEKLHVGNGEAEYDSDLYRDYLTFFNALVSADPQLVLAATQRLEAVAAMKDWLTDGSDRNRREVPESFDKEQVEVGVQLGDREERYADLVVFNKGSRSEPLIAVEYVENLKTADVWKWWEKNTSLRCIILISKNKQTYLERRIFTRRRRAQCLTEREDFSARMVKWPISFISLDDPGDRSIGLMLKAIQRGEDGFIGLVVQEWLHSSFVTLHGGMPYKPKIARQILDGLAMVSDHEAAVRVLWRTKPDPFERHRKEMRDGDNMDELLLRELHAPLWWRLPLEAKLEVFGGRGKFHGGGVEAGLDLLAQDLMGLSFDQDRAFRDDIRRHVEGSISDDDKDAIVYRFTDVFREQELGIEVSQEAPTELLRRAALDYLLSDSPERGREAIWETAKGIADDALRDEKLLSRILHGPQHRLEFVATNFLGSYNPANSTIKVYVKMVDWAARTLAVDTQSLSNVVLIQQCVHAMSHLGRDLDGRIWTDFAIPSSLDINFRPSVFHETIAHYFSMRLAEHLADPQITKAFKALADRQPADIQAARQAVANAPIEEMRKILIRTRNGLDEVSWPNRWAQ